MSAAVYFEFTVQGAYVKVVAIDATSGFEVSIVGSVATPRSELERLALRKLEMMRNRNDANGKNAKGSGTLA